MDAKKYIVYRPDESDLTCRIYVRCDCGRFDRNHECDPCEEEHNREKHCDDKKRRRPDHCEEESDWEDSGEEYQKKPWKHEEEKDEPEWCERHAKRSKNRWYDPDDSENGDQDDDHRKDRDDHRKDCDDHHWEPECPEKEQTHVHEFLGSTKLAEECEDRHNHRFAGVSSEEIPIPGGHIHRIITHTDFFDHFHDICKLTGPAIDVEDKEVHCKGENKKWHKEKKHVHFVEGWTTFVDGHKHEFQLATLIESPLLPQPKHDR